VKLKDLVFVNNIMEEGTNLNKAGPNIYGEGGDELAEL